MDPKGKIVQIEYKEDLDSSPDTEFFSGILIPGLVNAHTHLELSYLKGELAKKTGFVGFAKALAEKRNEFTEKEQIEAAEFQDAKMWKEGVQAVADICNSNVTFGVKKKSPIKYHSFIEVFGLGLSSIEKHRELCKEALDMGLKASITPHSAYSISNKIFEEAVGDNGSKLLSLHFMESMSEAELFQNRGKLREWYSSTGKSTDFTASYGSPLHRIVQNISYDRKLLSVHNTHITESDLRMLKQQYADGVTLVLCPRSNKYIANEKPPIELIKNSGVRVAIGTDSLASNDSLSVVDELKMLKGVQLEEQLHWATLAGAQALGLDKEIGSLEVGKTPGIVLITNADMKRMRLGADAQTERII